MPIRASSPAPQSKACAVVLAGAQAPGLPAGAVFSNFLQLDTPTINGLGQVAFLGQTTGPGSPSGMSTGLWSEAGGAGLQLVAGKGEHAAGTPSGVAFNQFEAPVLNSLGETAFFATLTGSGVNSTNNQGLWVDQASQGLSLIARAGDIAPGTSGAVFSLFAAPAINSLGQIAFFAGLTGSGVNGNNDEGLWIERSPGDLQLVVRDGDTIEVSPGIFKTVSGNPQLASAGADDGASTGLSNNGRLTFELGFSDGTSGVFMITVPEPASVALAALAAGMLLLRRTGRVRRRRLTACPKKSPRVRAL